MTAIITDVHYRMSLALIRELGQRGVNVVCCEKEGVKAPLGFASKHCSDARTLPDGDYENALYDVCAEYLERDGKKPALMPVGAKTLAMLAKTDVRGRFSAVAGFCIPTEEQLDIFNDKSRTALLAKSLGIPTPEVYSPDSPEIAFPCVVKPVCGEKFGLSAAQRYKIVHTRDEMQSCFSEFERLTGSAPIVQKYLSGGAFGCSAVCRDGNIVSHICHRRIREYPVTGGPSSCCTAIHDERLLGYVSAAVKSVGYTGLAMFEFKADDRGEPFLLEINPRVWGTFPLTRVARSVLPYAWYCLSAGLELPEKSDYAEKRMIFAFSDLAAAAGYFRKGQKKRALGAVFDLLNPCVRDGLFEFGDARPAFVYLRSFLGGKG